MDCIFQLGDARVDEGALAEFCRLCHVAELSVLGSAARADMREDSDIDLLVEFLPSLDPRCPLTSARAGLI
jgi:predicted nucleotidyltransferase